MLKPTEPPRYPTGRPVIHGTHGIVSAGHHLTALSGMRMLLAGGNAFDAAVVAGFTANVVEPTASFSLGAEGSFLLYHAASGKLWALSGQGTAGGWATVDFFRERGLDSIPTGPGPNAELSLTVPGVVDAYMLMLETYGTRTLGEVMAPAIEYAQRGFPMYEFMYRTLQGSRMREQFKLYPPGGLDVFYPGGAVPELGQIMVQPQMAATLGRLVEAEVAASGSRVSGIRAAREMFYQGDIARTIIRSCEQLGALLSLDDMAGYRAGLEEPLRTSYQGYEVCGQPTWTQAAVLLQALNILEQFDLAAMGHNSARYVHTLTEALKLAFADRERYYGDPRLSTIPIDGLLSKAYAATRAPLIRPDGAFSELPQPGAPWPFSRETPPTTQVVPVAGTPAPGDGGARDDGGTTHLSIVDREGNMVCATLSGGNPAKSVFMPELGFCLSTRSEMFCLEDGHPNGLEPGKRPRTTLVNYMVCRDGQPVMTIGCPGGDSQTQSDLQLLLNVLAFGMDPQHAVEAPRFSSQTLVNSFFPHAYLPGRLNVEAGIPEDVRATLGDLGHEVMVVEVAHTGGGSGAIVTQRDPLTGVLSAGADPRRASYAIGW